MAHSSRCGSSAVLLVSLLSLSSSTTEVSAQVPLGTIQQIRPIRQVVCPDSAVTGDLFVSLQRGRVSEPLGASLPKPLDLNDVLVVGRGNDAKLHIESAEYGKGDMILAPLLPCPGWQGWREWRPIAAVSRDVGLYRLLSVPNADTPSRNGLALRIDRGGAYIQWDQTLQRPLRIYGGNGPYMQTIGTEFVVAVDSVRGTLLYVKSGSIGFQNSTVVATAGQVYAVLPSGPRQITSLSQPQMSQLLGDAQYHGHDVWQPPPREPGELEQASRRPSWEKVVGATALIGGVGYLIWDHWIRSKPSGQGNGTVVLRIPI